MTQQLADARSAVEKSMEQVSAARANLQTILDNLTAGVIVLDALARANRVLGTTTVIITHNVDIPGMADRVMEMHDGQISAVRSNEVKKSPLDLKW